jgi:uncharacterized protein
VSVKPNIIAAHFELDGTGGARDSDPEASAKVRRGAPMDDDADYALPVRAGQLLLTQEVQAMIADARLAPSIAVPGYIANYKRPR